MGGGQFKNLIKYFIVLTLVIIVIIGALVGTSFSLFSYNAPGRKENTIITGSSICDTSGANVPVLASNMIPVYYDDISAVWRKANSNNSNCSWYSYNDKMWANAVTVTNTNRSKYMNATAGTTIPMNDINTMWVWIPRFSAVSNGSYNGGTQAAPGAFNITFVDNKTTAHDAFTFGTQELNGFWMGKFETTGSVTTACADENCNVSSITILPNNTSLTQTVSSFFYISKSMEKGGNVFGFNTTNNPSLDIHVIKNNEWGAVVYLTQSIFGRCTTSTNCSEVGINNSGSKITGYGAPAGSEKDTNNGTYNTSLGMDASTTGNIYGVYDMSGGKIEHVMGMYKPSTLNNIFDLSGFSSATSNAQYDKLPNAKYYNSYTTEANYASSGLQHALTETAGWYGDNARFVYDGYPWFARGGLNINGSTAGVFSYITYWGSNFENYGSRFTITL